MPRQKILLSILCATSLLACTWTAALAKAPEATPQQTAQPPQATPSLNPITAVKAMNESIRAGDQQTRAAIESMNRVESKSAPSAPAQKAGGGKVIYGDIIIHK